LSIRRITQGYIALVAGTIVGKLLAAASEVLLGRSLGPEKLGDFGAWIVVLGYGLTVVNMGADAVATREIAVRPEAMSLSRASVRSVRLRGSLLLLIVGLIAALVDASRAGLIVPLSLAGLALVLRDDWALVAVGRERAAALASILRDLTYIVLLVFLAVPYKSVSLAATAFLAADLIWALCTQLSLGWAKPPHSKTRVKWFSLGWPVAMSTLLALSMGRIGIPLTRGLGGAEQAGLYFAAYRMLIAAQTLGAPLARVALPHLARDQESASRDALAHVAFPACFIGVVLSLAMFHMSPIIIRLLYGPRFEGAAVCLRVLSASALLSLIHNVYMQALVARAQYKLVLALTGVAAAANLVLVVLMVPQWGALGACVAAVSADAVLFTLLLANEQRRLCASATQPLVIYLVVAAFAVGVITHAAFGERGLIAFVVSMLIMAIAGVPVFIRRGLGRGVPEAG